MDGENKPNLDFWENIHYTLFMANFNGKVPRVLVVDDDESVASFLAFSLRGEGFDVSTARDAEAGISYLKTNIPDIILLDIMLPSMDGFAMCKKLRLDPRFIKTPVLFITAYAEQNSLARAKEAGAQGLIEKPIMFDELLLQVMDALAGRFTMPTRLKFSA
jgi:two-component system alkaline phosphatase synthesis response regulator PhoP